MSLSDKIRKTLLTKVDKPCKYELELKECGLEIIRENTQSTQNYVAIKVIGKDRKLVISTDLSKKTALFFNDFYNINVKYSNLKHVNLYNLIIKHNPKKNDMTETKVERMERLKRSLNYNLDTAKEAESKMLKLKLDIEFLNIEKCQSFSDAINIERKIANMLNKPLLNSNVINHIDKNL